MALLAFDLEALDLEADAFAVALAFAVDLLAVAFFAGFASAVERADLVRAARALPAAVCSPLALDALPAAMRALAALAAAALPTWRWACRS